jgi:hypothetical protein
VGIIRKIEVHDPTREKLEELSTHFNTSASTVIRHLIAQAEPEDFPNSWQTRSAESRAQYPGVSRISPTV